MKLSVFETPDYSPGFLLWHISLQWRTSIESVLKPHELTHPQFVILASLGWLTRDGASVTQAMVGEMAGLDPNTTSQIIKGLERKKLIKREQAFDGRAKSPKLTLSGRKLVKLAIHEVEMEDIAFFKRLSKTEMKYLLQIFQKLL